MTKIDGAWGVASPSTPLEGGWGVQRAKKNSAKVFFIFLFLFSQRLCGAATKTAAAVPSGRRGEIATIVAKIRVRAASGRRPEAREGCAVNDFFLNHATYRNTEIKHASTLGQPMFGYGL